jgi:DNA-binding FadR family transcriptional regulator
MTADGDRAGDSGVADPSRYRPGYELVAERLLQHVAEQDLRPGDRLPTEQGLAEILGVTRNVTREAVKVLAAMGRLSVRRGAGIFVAASSDVMNGQQLVHVQPTDLDQVAMLLDHRRLLEAETARRSATLATPIEVRAIRQGAMNSIDASADTNINEFAEADAEFHLAVAAAAHNVFLAASVESLRRYSAQSDLLLFHSDVPGSLEVAGNQHLAIAQAIADADPELAARLMTEHIDTTQEQFERKIRDRMAPLTRTNTIRR